MNNIIKLDNGANIEIINSESGYHIMVESKNEKLNIRKKANINVKENKFYLKESKNKLKKLRKINNYTVDEMANKLGICKGYYSLIENGKRRLYYDLAKDIANIFGLNPDDIFL